MVNVALARSVARGATGSSVTGFVILGRTEASFPSILDPQHRQYYHHHTQSAITVGAPDYLTPVVILIPSCLSASPDRAPLAATADLRVITNNNSHRRQPTALACPPCLSNSIP